MPLTPSPVFPLRFSDASLGSGIKILMVMQNSAFRVGPYRLRGLHLCPRRVRVRDMDRVK